MILLILKSCSQSPTKHSSRPNSAPKSNKITCTNGTTPELDGETKVSMRQTQTDSSLSSCSLQSGRSDSSLRRSVAGNQNLQNVRDVFVASGPSQPSRQVSDPGSRSLPSSPRIRRPPAKEIHHVDLHQTKVGSFRFEYDYDLRESSFLAPIASVISC